MEIWIGKQRVNDRVLVFDPAMQPRETSIVYLFDYDEFVMRKFDRKAIHDQIEPLNDTDARAFALQCYESWKRYYGKNFRRQELKITERRALRSTKPSFKSGKKRIRQTHCFDCGHPLSSKTDKLCAECHWIICPQCQSCGCIYRRT